MNESSTWYGGGAIGLGPVSLLMGLISEGECRAAILLAQHGIDRKAVQRRWPHLVQHLRSEDADRSGPDTSPAPLDEPQPSDVTLTPELEFALAAVAHRLRDLTTPIFWSTEHLLWGLVLGEGEAAQWLRQQGIVPEAIEELLRRHYDPSALNQNDGIGEPLDVPGEYLLPASKGGETVVGTLLHEESSTKKELPTPFCPAGHADRLRVVRIMDAAANRGREGLRVVEDYVRFVLDDRHLTEQLKRLRHELTVLLQSHLPWSERMAARETQADVGTTVSMATEWVRQSAAEVAAANFTRFQEALRSLEEFGKVLDGRLAAGVEALRYRSYTLQRAIEITRASLERLCGVRLYVLLDGRATPDDFLTHARALVAAGVHAIQFRDKRLEDRQLVQRGRLLREVTQPAGVLFIMNDRPDLAVLTGADGVHVGQEELSVKDARTIVGPGRLIGVSTHGIEQARQAVLDGADYLGVGPTFPSTTKQFSDFPGLTYIRAVAAEIRLPAFAIGGITCENLPEVLAAGLSRVAVSGAITSSSDPAAEVRRFLVLFGRENGGRENGTGSILTR